MKGTILNHTENARWGDRYSCNSCKKEMLIGGDHKPTYCYQCGKRVVKIIKEEGGDKRDGAI